VLEYIHTNKAMKEYQQKYIVRTVLYSKVTIVVLFLLVILLLRSIMELNTKRMDVNALKKESEQERVEIEKKVFESRKKNEFIKTDRGFEEYVRVTYPVVKDGEGVIVVYDDEKNPVSDVRETMTIWEHLSVMWNTRFSK
jgi:cell division protein FtsB